MEVTKRERKPNFGPDETLHLCTLVQENGHTLRGKFSPHLTANDKKLAWDSIRDGINASFTHVLRSTADCERRWYSVLRKARKDLASYNYQIKLCVHLSLGQGVQCLTNHTADGWLCCPKIVSTTELHFAGCKIT